MALSARDLSALGKPLAILAMIVAAGITGGWYSNRAVKKADADLSAARAQYNEAHERVTRSGDEYNTIVTFTPPYRELERRGLVGEEQRLSWVDALRTANADTQLYGVDFEVGPQQPYAHAAELDAGSLQMQQSLMKLRFGLLYEDDLIRFFRRLAAENVGTFSVNQCSLQRLATAEPFQAANQPMLKAECELAWITIPPPAPAEGS
jgi:hypothetical protein